MPPDAASNVVVVLEVPENGERLVWDFGKRQESVIGSTVGEVGDWLLIDGADTSVMRPLLRTSSAPIQAFPGRHVMLEAPVLKLPELKPDLDVAAASDRSKRFYSPVLGPVDAFIGIDVPENRLFNVQVVKVWPKMKAALKLKTGLLVEWMCREQAVSEQVFDSETEILRLLERLQIGHREGLVIRTTNDSHVIVSQTEDGDTQLFVARDADLHVGQVVHFLPVYECIDAPVHFAADCRAVYDGRVMPVKGDANQFLISSKEIQLVNGRYRSSYLGNLMDPKFVLTKTYTNPNDVLLKLELDLKAARVVFTAIGFAPDSEDDASSKARISRDRVISTSSVASGSLWESTICSGFPELPLEPQDYVLSVRCSGSSSVKNVDKTFFDCPSSDAKYPKFHTLTADLEKRFGSGALPVRSSWYEVHIRYVAHKCNSKDAPLAVVYELNPISPTVAGDCTTMKSTKHLEEKESDLTAARSSTISTDSGTLQPSTSTAYSGMPNLPLDPQHYSMSARCFQNKGGKSFFECSAPSAKYPKFHTLTNDLEQRFGPSGLAVVGGWYEVRLRYNLYAYKSKEAPLVCISALKPMQKPLEPYFSAMKSSKQLEDNEYELSAECTEFKGDEIMFRCAADGFTRQVFMMKTTQFPRTDTPVVGQWYELMLRFFTTRNPVAPAVNVSCAITISRPDKPYFRKRSVATGCLENPIRAPRADSASSAGSLAQTDDPEQDIQQLTAVICGQPNAREFELYSPTGWQPEPCFYTRKFTCGGQAAVLGNWYTLKVRMSYKPRVLSDVFRAELASPLLPTRVENGIVQLGTSLKPVRAIDCVPCTHSEDLGRVIDSDNVMGKAFNSRISLECWCTRRKATDAPSVKAAWKVAALARPDGAGQTAAASANASGMRTTTGAQSRTYYKQDLSGVICYQDDGQFFVFSPQLASEAVLEGHPDGVDIGQWIDFNVVLNEENEMLAVDCKETTSKFPCTPINRSLLASSITCDVIIPMRVDESDRTVSSNFIGRVRDVRGLASKAAPGIHKAVIRYVYEGADSGYWQLDYVYA